MSASGRNHDDRGFTRLLHTRKSGEMELVSSERLDPAVLEHTIGSTGIEDEALKAGRSNKLRALRNPSLKKL